MAARRVVSPEIHDLDETKGEYETAVPKVMEGIIDVVFKINERIWVGDYKTDQVSDSDLLGLTEKYREQGTIYREAVSRALGVSEIGCQIFLLRIGKSVEI